MCKPLSVSTASADCCINTGLVGWFTRKWKNYFLPKVTGRVFGVPLVRQDLKNIVQGCIKTRSGFGPEEQHAILYKGDIEHLSPDAIPLIRINSACFTGDIFHDALCDCNWQLEEALRMLDAHDGPGLVIYHFAHEGKAHGYFEKLQAFDGEMYPVNGDLRDFRTAVTILKSLGISRVRSMTNNPEKVKILGEYGIEVVECVGVVSQDPSMAHLYDYKAREWGHALPTKDEPAA
jgi:GTP cyclohydrolase II